MRPDQLTTNLPDLGRTPLRQLGQQDQRDERRTDTPVSAFNSSIM